MVVFRVEVTESGLETLERITDRRIQLLLKEKIRGLAHLPELQGEPLKDDLLGYRALHVVGNRYRIIYRVENETVTVFVVAAGIRKAGDKSDIYEVMRRYVRLGLVEVPDKKEKPRKKPKR
ncbi:type II toxin-antitoxin system mRNA interferase toxin, RelE/StbE family [bacterium]|nr:type II toxin-antitoxin system mRNA interferase toxin, RelE/StbE family [bacterium]